MRLRDPIRTAKTKHFVAECEAISKTSDSRARWTRFKRLVSKRSKAPTASLRRQDDSFARTQLNKAETLAEAFTANSTDRPNNDFSNNAKHLVQQFIHNQFSFRSHSRCHFDTTHKKNL